MKTDDIPSGKSKEEYLRSDAMRSMHLPSAQPLRDLAMQLKEALSTEDKPAIKRICISMLTELSAAYAVAQPPFKLLNARPRKVRSDWVTETFGDYDFDTMLIRLWMRTAVQKKPTSYGTFLSTLCHEFCHHLDVAAFGLPNTFHTRGFYERAGALYHHVQNTPVRPIIWTPLANGTFVVDWAKTMRAPMPAHR
ncbi:MAG TPA: hypothetical protein V6D17_23980 [Candidatus Obscuribacterales bacterium]